jgi:transcriptional regulator with XRE-family HTH domain
METNGWGYFMQSIGGRIKSMRLSKRLTQAELAYRVGVTQAAIAKIETNKTKHMEGVTLEKLARELSSTDSYILHGAANPNDMEGAMLAAEMAAIFNGLPLSDKETILRMARAILPTKTVELLPMKKTISLK